MKRGFEMNLMHLKYAVEIAKNKSISRTAEKLYMGQPNLSRAIKELEEKYNVKVVPKFGIHLVTTYIG